MQYTIEDHVIFRQEDGALWRKDNEDEKTILPPIVTRLMTLLLEEQGKVMTRDDLMNRVWTVHGLEPSGNSLNQYISLLRRNLLNLGLGDNIIQTLPRIGFIVNNEIKISKAETPVTKVTDEITLIPTFRHKVTVKRSAGHWVFLILIFVVSMTALPLLTERVSEKINDKKMMLTPTLIGSVGNCHVYGFNNEERGSAAIRDNLLQNAMRVLQSNDIICRKDDVVFFSAQNRLQKNNEARVFVSVCNKTDDNITVCHNNFFNNWL